MRYFIASLIHTQREHEHITFWRAEWNGYTPVLGEQVGEYEEDQALELNDGHDSIAVPVDAVRAIQSPEPCYKSGARFYADPGPVVENNRTNWNRLFAARLAKGRKEMIQPEPEVFRGPRTAIPCNDSRAQDLD